MSDPFGMSRRRIVRIADKEGRIAKRVAAIDDDVAAPLVAELHTLAANKKAMERERDELRRRIAVEEAHAARLRSLSQWCQTVATNLDTLTYDERRLALSGLGVTVRLCRPGASEDQR